VKKILLSCFLCILFSANAQHSFYNWPTTGMELIKKGDLPVVGEINDRRVFYFNLNENGWDSVYTYGKGYYKVKSTEDGGWVREFSEDNNPNYRQVDLFTTVGFNYASYTIRHQDSTYRTFYANGKLKTRQQFSQGGYGSFQASKSHHRYEDRFTCNDGRVVIDLVKDTLIHGRQAVVSAKVIKGDTSSYEIKDVAGTIWQYVGEDGRVSHQVVNQTDTFFRIERQGRRVHLWWKRDSICDTTWSSNGALRVVKTDRRLSKVIHEQYANSIATLAYIKESRWGVEKERYWFSEEGWLCSNYSYHIKDTLWSYSYYEKDSVIIANSLLTPTGKLLQKTTWKEGGAVTVYYDTLLSGAGLSCGTNFVDGIVPLKLRIAVVLDSVVTEGGEIASVDESELMFLTRDGWMNWSALTEIIKKELNLHLEPSSLPLRMLWSREEGKTTFEPQGELDGMYWSTALQVGDVAYKSVNWNNSKGERQDAITVYFHIQRRTN
jgi:hypothetical protein